MYNIMKIPKLEKYFHLLSITIVMFIIDHCIHVKIMIALQFLPRTPQVRKTLLKSGKSSQPPKKGLFDPKKMENLAPKKKSFPESIRTCTFCKKPGQIWYILASGASFTIYSRL